MATHDRDQIDRALEEFEHAWPEALAQAERVPDEVRKLVLG